MVPREFGQFLLSVVVPAGVVLGAAVTPPDPYSQILANLAFLPIVLVDAYVLTYRTGFQWTSRAVSREITGTRPSPRGTPVRPG